MSRPRLTDSKTEPSSPSRPPAPEQTNTNGSLNMQTKKDVKEPNSAHRARAETCVSKCFDTEFTSSCSCRHIQNYVKILVLESILKKNCWLCLNWEYEVINWDKNWMCIIIVDGFSLKVSAPNYLATVGVLNVNPRKWKKENHSLLLTELLCSFNNN